MNNKTEQTEQENGNLKEIIDNASQSPPGQNELNKQETGLVTVEFTDVVESLLNEAQFAILQGRTPKKYIKKRPGKGGKTFSYVPHGYVTAVLNRAFGFDWDFELVPVDGQRLFLYLEGGKSGQRQNASVIVHGKLTVRIRDKDKTVLATITKTSTGEKEEIKGMSWGGLIKSAESDAFKKAASRLGVALDLYWQDADEDYIPAEKLDPKMQELVDAIKTQDENGGLPAPPELLAFLIDTTGIKTDLPTVAKAIAIYQKLKAKG